MRRIPPPWVLILLVILSLCFWVGFFAPLPDDGGQQPERLALPNSAWLDVSGVRLHYRVDGPSDGTPVLLVHGLFGSTETWRYNVDALIAAGYRVIRYDRLGFGLSDKPADADYSLAAQIQMALALLDALGVQRALVVGHSAGGNLAAHFALQHPERVQGLVLVDALLAQGGPPAFVGWFVSLPLVWRAATLGLRLYFTPDRLAETLRGFYASPATLTDADLAQYWRAFQTEGWSNGLLATTRDGSVRPLRAESLAALTTPTIVIWGELDRTTPLDAAQPALDQLPNLRARYVIPEVGHQPFEEASDAFNAALLEALAQLRSP